MGSIFEELIRKFAEQSNETAGDHFTPRDVIRLMADLLFIEDDDVLSKPGVVRTVYDPTAGTGGMLSVAGEYLESHGARVVMVGQELNDESYAICKADMLIKGQDVRQIKPGDTLANDGHAGETFDYMLSNPPFGVEWKQSEKAVRKEAEQQGYNGRFGPGLPRISDGSLLFMLHLVKKMRPVKDGGARFIIVQNGSPLFTGGAGSGESEIRRYLLENDLVEAIVALPTEMFYNTGIATYLWIVTNHKLPARKGKLQLIDASSFFGKMRKSLGSKRRELTEDGIHEITRNYARRGIDPVKFKGLIDLIADVGLPTAQAIPTDNRHRTHCLCGSSMARQAKAGLVGRVGAGCVDVPRRSWLSQAAETEDIEKHGLCSRQADMSASKSRNRMPSPSRRSVPATAGGVGGVLSGR